MRRTRCYVCGERALADDLDVPALCEGCKDDYDGDSAVVMRNFDQLGAQFVGHERGTRDAGNTP